MSDPTRTTRSSSEVRSAFLDFFAKRGHEIVPSSPLLPQNDPTLMFTNAGMVPFKDVFTGQDARPYKRAASSQKCIRISGKHNDLENVGVTARHQTFFEMLGNFSFGDYFKEEAIVAAWELLTKVWEVPTSRLVVTVFKGEDGVPADDEAAELWKKVTGFGDDRVLRLGKADNFWSMGDTGPCGPCSEIHFFHGDEPDVGRFGEEPRIDGLGWTEIWNLVFMQFDRREKDGPMIPLPAPSVDTGMGLERITAVLQGVTSNYDTDILRVLVDRAAELAGKPYRGSTERDDVSMRVIADHARTTAFLMAEGVLPERQKREYVLRRVMRRAIRHGFRLGIDRPFLHEVALACVDHMSAVYPELARRRDLVARVTEEEETRFRVTLRRGLKILDEKFTELRGKGEQALTPEFTADLYTTYGFPPDLTAVIAGESGFGADLEGADRIIHGAQEVTGPIDADAAVDEAYREVKRLGPPVRFTGYEREEGASRVRAIIRVAAEGEAERRSVVERAGEGDAVEIVVDETPFYGESGGQVGDRGALTAGEALVEITDTQRPLDGLVVHRGVVRRGSIGVGDAATLAVDHAARSATRRNHSATHLLHYALRKVLGEHAQQKGSRVGPDVLRFDFAHGKPLTREETRAVEDLVNAKVLENAPVTTEVLPVAEAKARGAMAIFEEKYGDVVRVLTMTADSVELCGGTHARALGDIGLFKITGETSVAAGVRRVFAATGENALAWVREQEDVLGRVRAALKAGGGDVVDKAQRLAAHERELEKKIAELEKRLLEGGGGGGLDGMLAAAVTIGDVRVLARRAPDGTQVGPLRELAEKLRDKLGGPAVVLLGAAIGDKAMLVSMVSKDASGRAPAGELVKAIAKIVGGSGGGRPDMAQAGGADVARLDEAIAAVVPEVGRLLGA